jgi:mRNA interferase HigB
MVGAAFDMFVTILVTLNVRIITEKALREFIAKHTDSAAPLRAWCTIVRKADWRASSDVKETFSNSDLVGDKTVFNIAKNRYRLIAFIAFGAHKVFVKAILTNKEYDKGEWKK